jgi:flagellar capping protein FliD
LNLLLFFSEPVTGFENSDITTTGTANATTTTVTEIAPNDGTTYQVSVTGMTSNGTVIAAIAANTAKDAAGNDNEASTSTDNEVTYNGIDNINPTVTINQASSQSDPLIIPPFISPWFSVKTSKGMVMIYQ